MFEDDPDRLEPSTFSERVSFGSYEPHPDIDSATALHEFHEEVSIWNLLRRNGVNPVAFVAVFTALVVVPGAILTFHYRIDYALATPALLAVLTCNTVLTFGALFYMDRNYPRIIERIHIAFDLDDEAYYGFFGRMFEQVYHWSFYSPIAPGPNGRSHHPAFWAALAVTYLGWSVVLVVVVPPDLPASLLGQALAVGYFLFIVGFATITLFTAVMFLVVTGVFMTVRASKLPIRLNFMLRNEHYGLRPFGRFLFSTLFIFLAAVAVAGGVGLLTFNPLLLIFAALGTPLALAWFVASQWGIHRAIVKTKRSRLRNIQNAYADQMDQICVDSTPEPDIETIDRTESFITLKEEIEELPDWPSDTKTLYQVLTTTAISNLPSGIGLGFLF